MLWLLHYQDETTAKYLPFRSCVWCKPVLDRNFDRNADTLQQTIQDVGEQDPALQATGRTATNSHGQSMPYPPFGTLQKIQIFIQQFDYLQYFPDSPKCNQILVRSSLNHWKI